MRLTSATSLKTLLVVCFFLTASLPAYAVDGVVLIDQARAVAGNITPGDAPGFPVSITRAGSYKLAGNLLAPEGVNGIEISSSNVTLDLNGFTLAGPAVTLTVCPDPCFNPPNGITTSFSPTLSGVAIKNGIVYGFAGQISLGTTRQTLLQDLVTSGVPGSIFSPGVNAGLANVHHVHADGQLSFICPGLVSESVSPFFLRQGFVSAVTCAVVNSSGQIF